MRATIAQRVPLPERSATLLVRPDGLWVFGVQSRELVRFSRPGAGPVVRSLALRGPAPEVRGIAWTGTDLVMADVQTRRVFRVDPATGASTLLVDPETLAFGPFSVALKGATTVIGDITWHNGLLVVASQSGYSSSIYWIDPVANRVVAHRWAPGPEPTGVEIDPVDGALYVIDARNRELRRFSSDGAMSAASLPADLQAPRGLAMDADRALWTSDWQAGAAVRLSVED